MVTLNQIVYDILNISSRGIQSDDFRISERQCQLWVNEIRHKLISQAKDRGKPIDLYFQHLTCLELEEVNASECCDFESDCTLLRSTRTLPTPIEIVSVTTVDNKYQISPTTEFRVRFNSGRYTSSRPKWFYKEDYLYVINSDIEKVNIVGVFEDPTELSNFTSCGGVNCFSADTSAYPIPLKMASDIVDIVFKTKVLPTFQMPQDDTNNSNQDK